MMLWYIHASAQLCDLHDEFVEGPLRLILRGNRLEVTVEVTPVIDALVGSANALAQSYVDALRAEFGYLFRAMTEREYLDLPAFAHQNEAMMEMELPFIPADKHSRAKLRAARNRVISYAWPLKACYEYAEESLSDDERFFPESYKMLETMAKYCGDRQQLKARTGLAAEVELLARLANEGQYDERHPPKDSTPPSPPTTRQCGEATRAAVTLLRKFEQLCWDDKKAG
jgi:hypothetical protein